MTDITTTLAERGTRYGDFPGHAKITQGLKRTMQASPKWGSLTDEQIMAAARAIERAVLRANNLEISE